MDIEKIKGYIAEDGAFLPEIFFYESTDSTNQRAREYARDNPEKRECAVFIADSQTAGRGRRGRKFFSERGAGIYISFLLYPKERGALATKITALAAVAAARAIERTTGLFAGIKWVNDLYINGKKLAGILAECEMSQSGEISHLVLGMGINVYKTELPSEIQDIATSIEDAGVRTEREKLSAELISALTESLSELDSPDIYKEYKERLIVLGRDITVIRGADSYPARVLDVTEDYSLLVELENGTRETLLSGEISTKI